MAPSGNWWAGVRSAAPAAPSSETTAPSSSTRSGVAFEVAAVGGVAVLLGRPGRVQGGSDQGQSLDEAGADDDPFR